MRHVPKKKQTEPPDVQSKRFVEDAQRMIDAGELSPTEADAVMDRVVRTARNPANDGE